MSVYVIVCYLHWRYNKSKRSLVKKHFFFVHQQHRTKGLVFRNAQSKAVSRTFFIVKLNATKKNVVHNYDELHNFVWT